MRPYAPPPSLPSALRPSPSRGPCPWPLFSPRTGAGSGQPALLPDVHGSILFRGQSAGMSLLFWSAYAACTAGTCIHNRLLRLLWGTAPACLFSTVVQRGSDGPLAICLSEGADGPPLHIFGRASSSASLSFFLDPRLLHPWIRGGHQLSRGGPPPDGSSAVVALSHGHEGHKALMQLYLLAFLWVRGGGTRPRGHFCTHAASTSLHVCVA